MSTTDIIAEMYSRPSLASSTASRIETGAKHMQQCRISFSHLLNFLNGDDDQMLRRKELYCVHKDEVIIGVGDALLKNSPSFSRSAYPLIISTMAKQDNSYVYACYNFYYTYALNEYIGGMVIEAIDTHLSDEEVYQNGLIPRNTDEIDKLQHTRKAFVDMRAVGISTTQGFAHHNSGDTMSTVMIMGLHTTMNGAYPMETGDIVMWYWDFEVPLFDTKTGQRVHKKNYLLLDNDLIIDKKQFHVMKQRANIVQQFTNMFVDTLTEPFDPTPVANGTLPQAEKRRKFHDRQQVMGEKGIARIKPYVFNEHGTHPDCRRVFAVAMSSARPFEMVDIRISRQSL